LNWIRKTIEWSWEMMALLNVTSLLSIAAIGFLLTHRLKDWK
jgi:hypothetical protein